MMKRNEERVPSFDDIIFENRNREYGAYDLRKRYKSVTSLSILGTVTIFTVLMLLFAVRTRPASGVDNGGIIVIIEPEVYKPPVVEVPAVEPPADIVKPNPYIPPEVVDDTSAFGNLLPITDVVIETSENGDTTIPVIDTEPLTDIIPPDPDKVEIIVQEMPMFPGGDAALLEYIKNNTIYPEDAIDNNIEGRVILRFVVTRDGSVGKIEILKGVDPLLDAEASRVVSTLPRFKPGKQSGNPVNVWFSVPVLFQIKR